MEYLQSSRIGLILLVLLYATTETATKSTEAEEFFNTCLFEDKAMKFGGMSVFEVVAFNKLFVNSQIYWETRVDFKNQRVEMKAVQRPDKNDYKSVIFDYKQHKIFTVKNKEICTVVEEKETKPLDRHLVLPPTFPPNDSIPCGIDTKPHYPVNNFYSKKYDFWYGLETIKTQHHGYKDPRDSFKTLYDVNECSVHELRLPGQMKGPKPTCDTPKDG